MKTDAAPEMALAGIAEELPRLGYRFALVGGLAVSVRSEIRFTRDVDLAVVVADDAEAESLIFQLRSLGYVALASVEHVRHQRLATARLRSPVGVAVDLMFASCGIEQEIVARASEFAFPGVGPLPVAEAEELIAMKVLSMTEQRLQDRLDALHLLRDNRVALDRVRENLALIEGREYHRQQDLMAKLESLVQALG